MSWGLPAAAAVQAVGAGLSGGGQDQMAGNLHLVNPAQQALYNMMTKKLLNGSGDFGFGQAVKSGKKTLQGMMANNGISPQSGVYNSSLADMTATAANQDAGNRRNTMLSLMGTPLQTATVSGANFVPGSLSRGVGTQQQQNFLMGKSERTGNYGNGTNWRG